MKRIKRKLKKYLIPHEENQFKPYLLRAGAIGFICLIMVLAEAGFLLGPSYLANRSKLFGVIVTNALIDGTNQSRVANNLPPLTVSPLLQAAAQEKADDMVKNDYFAHTSPSGITPWYWFQNVGYNFEYAGENLAVNFSDSQDVTNAWMNSPEHRANILDANFTQIGMAIATGTYQGALATYVVELFGTPVPAAAPVAFVNTASAANAPASVPVTAPKASQKTSAPTAVPVIIAASASANSSSQASFVAVKGAATQADTSVPSTTQAVTASVAPASGNQLASQDNPFQEALASPGQLVINFLYLLVGVLAMALLLNIFIKIRIQHPQLIFNGMLVMAIAVVFIVLNQQLLLSHGVIF